jgi:predicted Fe-S protein YdhL (DUF1289 family)
VPKTPSPCIDVCKFKLRGHCIGCGMTKAQKSASKAMDDEGRRAFLATVLEQQRALGGKYRAWPQAYRRKCEARGAACPLDETMAEA